MNYNTINNIDYNTIYEQQNPFKAYYVILEDSKGQRVKVEVLDPTIYTTDDSMTFKVVGDLCNVELEEFKE